MNMEVADDVRSSPLMSSDLKVVVSDKSIHARSPSKFANEPPLSVPDSNQPNTLK